MAQPPKTRKAIIKPLANSFSLEVGAIKISGKCEFFLADDQAWYLIDKDVELETKEREAIGKVFEAIKEVHRLLGDPFGHFTVNGK